MINSAMILGAGRGTRLGKLSETVPKVLVDIDGAPLLERQLAYLQAQGVTRVVVNAHHLAHQVQEFAAEYGGEIELQVAVEDRLLGTAGGVRHVIDHFSDGPFIVLYGDVVVDEPLADLIAAHERSPAMATLTVYRSVEVDGKGVVIVDGSGAITGFAEKQVRTDDAPVLINAGVYVVDPRLISGLPPATELDFGHDVFPDALRHGLELRAHVLQRQVIDVGTPDALARARESFERAAP